MTATGFDKIAQKAQRLSEKETAMKKAMKTRGKNLLPGDVLIVPLQNAPEEVDAFWVVLAENEEEKDFVLIVPADTYDLVGSTDMKIPDYSYMSGLVLRLGQPQWYKKDLFSEKGGSRKVGFIDDFFVERARSVVARLIRLTWEGNPLQKKVDNEEEYRRWGEKIHLCSILLYQKYEELMAKEYAQKTVPAADSRPQHAVPELHAPESSEDRGAGKEGKRGAQVIDISEWQRVKNPIHYEIWHSGQMVSENSSLQKAAGNPEKADHSIPLATNLILAIRWDEKRKVTRVQFSGKESTRYRKGKPRLTFFFEDGSTPQTFVFDNDKNIVWEIPLSSRIVSFKVEMEKEKK